MQMVNVFTTESFPAEYRVFECIFARQSGKRLPLRKTGLTPYLQPFGTPIYVTWTPYVTTSGQRLP